jgi:ABC-type sugar transport system permease subunit
VLTVLIFQEFFQRVGQVGYGAATAILLFVLLFLITLLQLRFSGDRDRRTERRAARGMRGSLRGS